MTRILASLSALAVISAAPAIAQVTAEEVWADWQEVAAASGQEITADVTEVAGGLELSNLRTRSVQEDVSTETVVDLIRLTEAGDGSVGIELSQPYTILVTVMEGDDEAATIELLMTYDALDIAVSGPPDARSYSYSADGLRIEDGTIVIEGEDTGDAFDFEVTARGLAATYDLIGLPGKDQRFASEATVTSISGRMDLSAPPGEEGSMKMGFGLGEITSTGNGTILSLATLQESAGGIPEDFDVSGVTTYGYTQFAMSFEAPGEAFAVSYANEGGAIDVAFSDEALRYDISTEGMSASVEASDLPVPIDVSATSGELAFSVPLAAAAEPAEARLRIDYRDLVLGEGVWALVDPAGGIPRDPISVLLDATAQVLITTSLTDPNVMELEAPPGELRALTVSELALSFGDTALTGQADLGFAPGQVVPQPEGQASLTLSGGNALLDQLQAAGVIGPEEAGMARGVAGMFMRPGATPDTLETTIEFGADGRITANGVPLQ